MKTIELGVSNIESILRLEKKSFLPGLQASEETVKLRFANGHTMFGVEENGELIAKICFYYTTFSPHRMNEFPRTFKSFSSGENKENGNTAFVYNLDVVPEHRGGPIAMMLVNKICEVAKENGCTYVVADGRCPSYNGSSLENIEQSVNFKNVIDLYLKGGQFPSTEELCYDRLLGFYNKLGGNFTEVISDFIPEDEPSGGIRVMLVKNLVGEPVSLSEEWTMLSGDLYGDGLLAQELALFFEKRNCKTIIEYGCGYGQFSEKFSQRGFEVTGVDIDPIILSKEKVSNPTFIHASWLDFKPSEQYDVGICRGNSLVSASSWNKNVSPDEFKSARGLMQRSLFNMFESIKSGGLFCVDTVNQISYDLPCQYLDISTAHCELRGKIIHDYQNKVRTTSGRGWVNGRWFDGGASVHLLSPSELYLMMYELYPQKIWFQKFMNEPNYAMVCVIK